MRTILIVAAVLAVVLAGLGVYASGLTVDECASQRAVPAESNNRFGPGSLSRARGMRYECVRGNEPFLWKSERLWFYGSGAVIFLAAVAIGSAYLPRRT